MLMMKKSPLMSATAPELVPSTMTFAPGRGWPLLVSSTLPEILPVVCARANAGIRNRSRSHARFHFILSIRFPSLMLRVIWRWWRMCGMPGAVVPVRCTGYISANSGFFFLCAEKGPAVCNKGRAIRTALPAVSKTKAVADLTIRDCSGEAISSAPSCAWW